VFLVYVALLLDYVALPLDYLSHFLVYLAAPQHVGYLILRFVYLGAQYFIGWENDLPRKICLPLDRKTHIFPWEWVVLNKQAGPTLFISTAIMVR